MRLYHGSNVDITDIDLKRCRPYKDFGKGFYLTEIKGQALRMAENIAAVYGGEPILNEFDFNEDVLNDVKFEVRRFSETPTIEWAQFIVNNRNKNFVDFASPECNFDNKYDIVIGPVADDRIAATIRRYMTDKLDVEGLRRQLTYRELTNQYSFHTEKAIACLKKVVTINE